MAIVVNFAGASLKKPGAYSRIIVAQGGAAQAQLGVMAIIGEASSGAPFSQESGLSAVTWTPDQFNAIADKYGSGALVDASRISFAPSNDPQILGGAQQLLTMKTNQSVKAAQSFSPKGLFANFVALLTKLDNDTGVTDTNYTALLTPVGNLASMISQFNSLLTKLDNDAGVTDTNYHALLSLVSNSTFVQLSTNFNSLLAKLDLDGGVADTNYAATLTVSTVIYGSLAAKRAGTLSNSISVEIDQTTGVDTITITDTINGISEISDPIGNDGAIQVQVTGTGVSAATLTVSATTITTTVTGGNAPSLSIPKTMFNTLGQLVGYLNVQHGYTASVLNNHNNDPLSVLDYIQTIDVFTAPATIKKDHQDIFDFFALSNLVTFTQSTFVGVPDAQVATFMTGGALGATSQANIQDCMDALSKTRVNFVVPLFSQDATADIEDGFTDPSSAYTIDAVHAALNTHCVQNSTVKGRRERQGFAGFHGTFSNAKAKSANLGASRVSLMFQDVDIFNASGNALTAQPHMLAVLAAGMKSAAVVGLPNTFKLVNISGFSMPANDFDPETQADDAIDANLTFVESAPGGGFRFVLDNSTYGQVLNAWIFSRPSVLYAADTLAFSIRLNMETFVGQRNSDVTPETVKNLLISVLDGARSSGIIVPDASTSGKGFKDLTVTFDGSVIKTSVTVTLVEGIEFVLNEITVQRAQS